MLQCTATKVVRLNRAGGSNNNSSNRQGEIIANKDNSVNNSREVVTAVSKEDMLVMVVPVKMRIRTLKLAPFSFADKNSRQVRTPAQERTDSGDASAKCGRYVK